MISPSKVRAMKAPVSACMRKLSVPRKQTGSCVMAMACGTSVLRVRKASPW